MGELKLVKPAEQYLESYLEACREYKREQVAFYTLHDPDQYPVWRHTIFKDYARQDRGGILYHGYVPSTTYWAVEDGAFIGIGNIRHKLTPALRRFGGHIGYAVRASRWGQGYGTRQLALLLQAAAALGINPALVTCNLENRGSAKVIEKNGGVYIDTIPNHIDGKDILTCRFWVPTDDPQTAIK